MSYNVIEIDTNDVTVVEVTETELVLVTPVVNLITGASGDYLPLAGGAMDADATIALTGDSAIIFGVNDEIRSSGSGFTINSGETMQINTVALTVNGDISATNLSGTNTGDQDITNLANVETIQFDIDNANPAYSEGKVFYDQTKKALSYYNDEADVTINLGQEVLIRVKNLTGSTIPNGAVVYPNGFDGGDVTIGLAIAHDKEKCRLIGVVTHSIPTGETGYVTKLGEVGSLNTDAFVSGDVIYLSPNVAGGITKTKPIGASYITRIGAVKIKSATTGSIVVDIATSEQTVEVTQDVGFSTAESAEIEFTDTVPARTLTINSVGTDYCWYQYGDKYCKATDSIPIPDEEGLYVIYYNLGTLAYIKNPSNGQIDVLIRNNPIVSYVYWNATDNKSEYVGKEMHGIGMNGITRAYLHFAFGARYLSGLAPNNITADGSGNDNASAQFGVDSGDFIDEDIYHAYPGKLVSEGLPIAYLSGTTANPTLRTTTNAGYSILTSGTGRMAFNTISAGSYILSEVSNNNFALCHLIAINENDASKRIVAFVGQAQYTTITSARDGAQNEIKTLESVGILPQESKAIASFVFETRDIYTNALKSRIRTISTGVNYVDWRTVYFNGSSAGTAGSGTGSTIFSDELFQIIDNVDATKVMRFENSGITTGQTRTLTVPNASGTIALTSDIIPASEVFSADGFLDGSVPPDGYELLINTKKAVVRKFSGTVAQDVDIPWCPRYKIGTNLVQFRVIMFIDNATVPTTGQTIIWKLSGTAYAESDNLNKALGTAVSVTYTAPASGLAQYDRISTGWSGDVTITDLATLLNANLNLQRDTATDTYEQKIACAYLEVKYNNGI